MTLLHLLQTLPKSLYDDFIKDSTIVIPLDVDYGKKTQFETWGDFLDIRQIIEDTDNYYINGGQLGESPLDHYFLIKNYMMASYGLFSYQEVKNHLESNPFLNLYPNLYRTMEVWAWG